MKKILKTQKYLPGVPLVDSPFFEHDARELLDNYQLKIALELREKGYAVFDFPDLELDKKIDSIKENIEQHLGWKKLIAIFCAERLKLIFVKYQNSSYQYITHNMRIIKLRMIL